MDSLRGKKLASAPGARMREALVARTHGASRVCAGRTIVGLLLACGVLLPGAASGAAVPAAATVISSSSAGHGPPSFSGDPDAGLPFITVDSCDDGDGPGLAGGEGCEQTGEYITVFSGAPRFRGNIYEILEPAQLTEFCMQLNIPANESFDVYFNVYEAKDAEPGTYVKIKEVIVEVDGAGTPTFYCSGVFVDENQLPQPVSLLAGKTYFVGCAWGTGRTVAYGRDNRTYPRPFSVGNTLGLTGGSLPPPLPDEMELSPGTTGAYSLKLCIKQQGVCCVQVGEDWECTSEFEEVCAGQFTAPGVTCEDALEYWEQGCPLPDGACCFDEGCEDGSNKFACDDAGGTYMGHFTTCDTSCVQGACCFTTGECLDGTTPEHCASLGGFFRGEDTECATVFPDCGNGACCVKEGCVEDVSRTLCQSLRGTWRGEGTACDTLDPHCTGVCCWTLDGFDRCDMLSPEDCEQLPEHKFYGYGKLCSDFPAPCGEEVQYGACCLPDGRCFFTSDFSCEHLEGSFSPDQQCSELNCPPQACCFDDGRACIETSAFACGEQGGTPMGDGSSCVIVECSEGLEACCFFNESCSELPRSECLANGGVPLGQGTTCDTVHCLDPVACCLQNGSCTFLPPFQCLEEPGIPRNKGVSCEDAVCELPVPACCFDDGSCLDLAEGQCFAQGGRPREFGVSCSDGDVCTINCAKVTSLVGKCKDRGGAFQFKATVKTTLPVGTTIVVVLDGTDVRTGTVNARGKVVVKWSGLSAGDHTACLEDCPLICVTKTCTAP